MPFPVIAIAGAIATVAATSEILSHNQLRLQSKRTVKPVYGSIVCCEVYEEFEHTGVWLDEDIIIEFSNNGLIKSMTPERFVKGRSGNEIYVACNDKGSVIANKTWGDAALKSIFTYQNYHLLMNNCHSFVASCIDQQVQVRSFSELHDFLSDLNSTGVVWDKVKV